MAALSATQEQTLHLIKYGKPEQGLERKKFDGIDVNLTQQQTDPSDLPSKSGPQMHIGTLNL